MTGPALMPGRQRLQRGSESDRKEKLIMTALWTEACLTFPALDALRKGYEIFPVVDAVGGTSLLAHETGLRRIEQASARLTSFTQVTCELQRDWNRTATAVFLVKALRANGSFLNV